MEIHIPYGKGKLKFHLPDSIAVETISAKKIGAHNAPKQAALEALNQPQGRFRWNDFVDARTAAIAINDKTRPVPHDVLLPPLLQKLEALGFAAENIILMIATGAHHPMLPDEFLSVLPESILDRYSVVSHDCDAQDAQEYLGKTKRGTPIWVNTQFVKSDLKIVIGNIEPHQFQGFSGGAKSASIGLAGRETINHNHSMMILPNARLGEYDKNPARQDIEEMGKILGVDLAMNAILDQEKKIVKVLAGDPCSVMKAGIPLARKICQVAVLHSFDLMIVSPGGYPKDINVYQAQKGLAHALQVMNAGGSVFLTAACTEGSGSSHYEDWVVGKKSSEEVIRKFKEIGFQIGPHKAYQIARDSTKVDLMVYSELEPKFACSLLLNPIQDFQSSLDAAISRLKPGQRVGILPYASSTIPHLE